MTRGTLFDGGTPIDGPSNIVAGTRRFFTGDLVGRIALHRRLNRDSVDRAVTLAQPFLLAALANLASRPKGARSLAYSVARQYPATLDTIRNGIGSESQDVAAAYGSGYIAHLLGTAAFATVCADVARLSSLSDQEAKLLVGLVGWILMSQVRVEQRRQDLSPPGLAHLLHRNCNDPAEGIPAHFGTQSRRPAPSAA
jgi:hypothetical protein